MSLRLDISFSYAFIDKHLDFLLISHLFLGLSHLLAYLGQCLIIIFGRWDQIFVQCVNFPLVNR